jgi:hypothetical protein
MTHYSLRSMVSAVKLTIVQLHRFLPSSIAIDGHTPRQIHIASNQKGAFRPSAIGYAAVFQIASSFAICSRFCRLHSSSHSIVLWHGVNFYFSPILKLMEFLLGFLPFIGICCENAYLFESLKCVMQVED